MNVKRKSIKLLILILIASFSFDSSLKLISGGVRVHAGLLIILLTSISLALITPQKLCAVLNRDKFIIAALSFLFLHSFFARDLGNFIFLSSYLIISIFIYYFISVNLHNIDTFKTAKASITLLLITGLIQFTLSNALSYPLIFGGMDLNYYIANPQFEKRMRGFFLEPNWFGLILLLWSCALFAPSNSKKSNSEVIKFLALALIAQYLTGNRLTLLLQTHLLLLVTVSLRSKKISRLAFSPAILVSASTFLFFTANYIFGLSAIESDRSAIARIATLNNVLEFFSRHYYAGAFTGYGFSNWAAYSNEHLLSFSNYLGEQELSRRDNSEIYVVLFEAGVLGLALFWLDMKRGISIENGRKQNKIPPYSLALSYFFVCSLFYPTYTFTMYCIPLITLRAITYQAKSMPTINSLEKRSIT
ncbi:hypothetical protein D9M69_282670 [compost metagenome]